MEESILLTIKKLLGIAPEYTHFDEDVKVHINTALMTLQQLGMIRFSISGIEQTWGDYIDLECQLEAVKTYIYMQVKMIFDPPQSSTAMQMLEKKSAEYEWRIIAQLEGEF